VHVRRNIGLLIVVVVAGCRATVAEQPADLLPPPDLAFIPVGPADLSQDDAGPDMFVCPKGAEICDDQCDNDGNSYTDADDPACTPQLLVTHTGQNDGGSWVGTPQLWRLVLDDHPRVAVVNPNAVPSYAMANFNAAFSSSFYEVLYNGGGELDIPSPLLGVGPLLNLPPFSTRDVCTFNNELIVLEPRTGIPALPQSTLHRMRADGMTEILPSVIMTGVASACASDGELLYVSFYQVPTPSRIEVFTKGDNGPVDTGIANAIPMPPSIVASCCDRLIDFAFVKKGSGFIGLFANGMAGTEGDNNLDGTVMAPFALDGGVGPAYDAGVWNGVGEFLP
jgi:hypothetical protein